MFVTGKHMPRRTFLRGVGVVLGLPVLEAMVPAVLRGQSAAPVHRLGFMYAPNGANQWKFMPSGEGTAFEFSPTLAPIADFRRSIFSYLPILPIGNPKKKVTVATTPTLPPAG